MSEFNLKAPAGAVKRSRRVGRGSSSGRGTTAGRGSKGQQSRSGARMPYVGFEGGQMPLYRRVARRGFSNYPFKKDVAIVQLAAIDAKFSEGDTVNISSLKEKGLVRTRRGTTPYVKILGSHDVSKPLNVVLDGAALKISAGAAASIRKAGGTVSGAGDDTASGD